MRADLRPDQINSGRSLSKNENLRKHPSMAPNAAAAGSLHPTVQSLLILGGLVLPLVEARALCAGLGLRWNRPTSNAGRHLHQRAPKKSRRLEMTASPKPCPAQRMALCYRYGLPGCLQPAVPQCETGEGSRAARGEAGRGSTARPLQSGAQHCQPHLASS